MPEMPDTFVQEVSERYIELYEKVSGKAFKADKSESVLNRIEQNVLQAL